jgi:LysR family transcriptional regulator, regulator for bpeEF and oprC
VDRLDAIRIFVRVVETGSFSKAAAAQGVVQSTASRQVVALEKHLGTQLLHRSSHGLNTTSAGRSYYESVVKVLAELDVAESLAHEGRDALTGSLRVAAPTAFGRLYIVPHLGTLMERHPGLRIDLDVADRYVNLIEEGIDVAIRIGHLSDSSLRARRVASFESATVASVEYLAKHPPPERIQQLEKHACIAFMTKNGTRRWDFRDGKRAVAFTPSSGPRFNDAESVRAAVRAGLGIAHSARWLFDDMLRSGEVKQVLASHVPLRTPVHAVWVGHARPANKVRAFIEFFAALFATIDCLKG